MLRDAKYLIAYSAPISAYFALYLGGMFSPATFYVGFVLIPLLEFFSPQSKENFSEEVEEEKSVSRFFDIMLYLNAPILYGLVFFYLYTISFANISIWELLGMTLSVGISMGYAINVAHELGHRSNKFEQFLSKMILMPTLYMHFFLEHNLGHHKNVATDEDPASSRLGENIYSFYFRTVTGSYVSAWNIQSDLLKRAGQAFYSIHNSMIWYHLIQLSYLLLVGLLFGWLTMFFAIVIGIMGFLLLETVNYVEHYGLRRKKLPNGRYEAVQPHHSWNSNHEVGRIYLYELTRHSDHHYKSNRKYQVLRHFDDSPQLPLGYPGSMLIAMFPPLWFRYMNPLVESFNSKIGAMA